ncbi:MAG TPA: histidine--tRNA ligase [Gemmatimonadales bacterium]|jgi:histidyl-tRNA synthetase|nr:histidine--tRNA ligase [Gemmatimonadales bacterium]
MPARALPGFRDFYPDDTALRNHIFAVWRTVATRYGCEEYDGPPLEPLELYTQKSGSEIVGQLYHFRDRGDREVALRPEMTPTLARMVAARASALKKPIRWFSIPQLFRYERQQRGRLREHFQLNLDVIGEPGPLADAEVIAAAIDVARLLGLGPADLRARLSDRRVTRALVLAAGVPEASLGAAYAAIDKIEREARDRLLTWLTEDGRFPKAVAQRVLEVGELKGLGEVQQAVRKAPGGAEAVEPLTECVAALEAMGLGGFVDVDLCIVRGLAYYSGIVFELFDAQRNLRAICGGGRYDGLLASLGGADLPAVGFGMGDVVLGELIKARALAPSGAGGLDAFLVAVTAEDRAAILQLAHALRDRGGRVEFSLKEQTIAKQLKLASARGARLAVIIGPEERKRGGAVVRDLMRGEERMVSAVELAGDAILGAR